MQATEYVQKESPTTDKGWSFTSGCGWITNKFSLLKKNQRPEEKQP
jgi:hypothetical protein